MKFAGLSLCLALYAASVNALPMFSEYSKTAVALGANMTDPHSSMVMSIMRVDDLVNDDGKVVAERRLRMDMNIDIVDDKVTMNGSPVGIGLSHIHLYARTIVDCHAAEVKDPKLAKDNPIEFGDVLIQVLARSTKTKDVNGEPIRRFTLVERVVEFNHQVIKESDFVELFMDVDAKGNVLRYPPNIVATRQKDIKLKEEQPIARAVHRCKHSANVLRWRLMFWWHSLPQFTRYVLAFAFVLINVLPLITVPVAVILMYRRRRAIQAAKQLSEKDSAALEGPKIYFVHMDTEPLNFDDGSGVSASAAPAYDSVVASQQQALKSISEKSRLIGKDESEQTAGSSTKYAHGGKYENLPTDDEGQA